MRPLHRAPSAGWPAAALITVLPIILAVTAPICRAALPPPALVLRCIDAVEQSGKAAGDAGPACDAMRSQIAADDAHPGDGSLAKALSEAGKPALRDYLQTLPRPPASAGSAVLDPAATRAIVAGLAAEAAKPKPKTFWERALDWLRALAAPPQTRGSTPHWLEQVFRWLGKTPAPVARGVGLSLLVILLGALLWVVVREIRHGTRGRRRQKPAQPRADRFGAEPAALTLAGIAGLSMIEQPAAFLRWLIGELRADGRLPKDPALTNRELRQWLSEPAGRTFGRIAEQAERSLYGNIAPDSATLAEIAALARTIEKPGA